MSEFSRSQDDGTTQPRGTAGTYPFPLSRGPEESPYLTWIRNHSNYMTARGLLDYLRAIGVLLRGMIINFLIFVPYLLALAIGLAYSHHWLRAHPFALTLGVAGLALAWVLIFALSVPILRVLMHNRSVETGSDSTVRWRDRYERSFGALLLAIVATFALESLPWLLETFHDRLQLGAVTWPGTLAVATAGLAALSGSNQLLAVLSGVRRQVAMVLVGLLGLLVPMLVVVGATDYLLYGLSPSFYGLFIPLAVPVAGSVGLMLISLIGVGVGAFRPRELWAVTGLLLVSTVLAVLVGGLGVWAYIKTDESNQALEKTLNQMADIANQFERVEDRGAFSPEVVALLDAGAYASGKYRIAAAVQDSFKLRRGRGDGEVGWMGLVQEDSRHASAYLASQMPLTSLAYRLSRRPDEELEPLRRELARLARAALFDSIAARVGGNDRTAVLLSSALLEHHLSPRLSVAGRFTARLSDPFAAVRERYARLAADSARAIARDEVRWTLGAWDAARIAVLLDDEMLMRAVEKKYADVPGTAKKAQLAGRRELVALLTREELVALVLPSGPAGRLPAPTHFEREALLAAAMPRLSATPDSMAVRTAAQLAKLVDRGRRDPEPGGDSTALRIGFFHRDTSANDPNESLEFEDAARDGPPTDDEIARAAARELASHAIADIDADYLRGLAFGETLDWHEWLLRSRVADAERGDSQQWRSFLSLERAPLDALVSKRLPAISPGEIVRYADRSDSERRAIWDRAPALWPAPLLYRYLVAVKALRNDTRALAALARLQLSERALADSADTRAARVDRDVSIDGFASNSASLLGAGEMARVVVAGYWRTDALRTEELAAKLVFGVHGRLERPGLAEVKRQVSVSLMPPKVIFVSLLIVVIWLGCWLTVDVNLTSVHGLYRDRLAAAFLVGKDTRGDIGIEDDVDLDELCRYEARSTAPYHIINVALNLQASRDIGIRDRQSDFFCFTPRFVGGHRTGYCRSETLEQVFPQMDVATAMAISAAAASPNMGRGTSPFLVAFMTLINVRLGYWLPNPGRLEGLSFAEVFAAELREIASRREQAYASRSMRSLSATGSPTVDHGLVGIGFSGGGIRSASVNLGISQALHHAGVFDHCDYMSTVSGGGYLGSSLSTLMRTREALRSEIAGTVSVARRAGVADERSPEQVITVTPEPGAGPPRTYRFTERAALGVSHGERIAAGRSLLRTRSMRGRSEVEGTVEVETADDGARLVRVTGGTGAEPREYRYSRFDTLKVAAGQQVKIGTELIRRRDTQGSRFRWRVRPSALVREALSKLNETHDWVNLSDGGHIENLAAIELLRRRCKYIIIGDGEADPKLQFGGLARLMRYASIDLGIRIEIELDPLRLRASAEEHDAGQVSAAHWAVGTITYPPLDGAGAPETGYLLYFKSSFTGDESEVIREYRHRYPDFPHQSTADQAFDEDQFESYRALGQHIAEGALGTAREGPPGDKLSYAEFESWIARLAALSGDTGRA